MSDLLERLSSALGDRYAIEREVGRGGMAVVFLAEDLKHHRQVAIKVLHPELTATLGAERFLNEIEIVAGLQHPHILPLYESGEVDGLLYYIMPFAEGESLRQRLDRETQLAVDESVRIAVEVADGLDYAHRKGVVHRDIKPGNILLSARHAVIADFGIARAIEAARAERVTRTGLGVGTPLYASPEQATAEETLDGRTDIYSLGCMLYEMLAGEPPLTGATPQMTQARRMAETPTQLHTLRDTVPPALDHVIARALAKIPADRYATASQFGQALQAVLFAATPAAHADLAMTPGAMATTPTAMGPEPEGKSRRWWLLAIPVVAIGLIAMLWPPSDWFGEGQLEITTSKTVRVTNEPGIEFQPAISPDGDEVAYVIGSLTNPRIAVRSTSDAGRGGGSLLGERVPGRHFFPKWMPDGAFLHFLALPCGSDGTWNEAGTRGGSVRTIGIPRLSSRYAWSRDGTRVAFSVGDSIFAYSPDVGESELLGVHVIRPRTPHSLAWSPDGRWIAYVNANPNWRTTANVAPASIWILDANGGTPVQVTDEVDLNVSPQWLPDSRHLLFVSDRDGARGIYVVEVGPDGPQGPPRSVLASSDPHSISISADGAKIAYSKFTLVQNIWSVQFPDGVVASSREATPVTSGTQVIERHTVSADGAWIAFDSDIKGEADIYKMRLEGGPPQPVADLDGDAFFPVWSPDGAEIAFAAAGAVFVVSANGGTPEQITELTSRSPLPDWSPDGLSIAFSYLGPQSTGPFQIWTVSRDSVGLPWNDPVPLTDFACFFPDWAPDGSGVLCSTLNGFVFVERGGDVKVLYDGRTAGLTALQTPQFSPDGSRVFFSAIAQDCSEALWWVPTEGGDATKLVSFDDPSMTVWMRIFRVAGDSFYFAISEYESDIWVVDLDW